ncbi:hypothetical protein [Polyangium sp. 6x1]|uniref:hypothetical protein n=1 Tax=Polyangium sp. 6x1 TaxID=3042689 RepID=UPI002483076B|nr:hypothetical protein [Polyangium sp. 6x1]MDI1451856.1 hypothetical protein [Polyangium sp. 6x1]
MSGFEFRETMAGSYHRVDEPHKERPLAFTIRARSAPILRFLRRPVVEIEGAIDAPGLADHRYLRGTLGMDLLRTGTLPYAFHFHGDDDKPYVFEGQKDVSVRELLESMTVLPGAIKDEEGALVARALLRFDARSDLVKFLRSFRLSR